MTKTTSLDRHLIYLLRVIRTTTVPAISRVDVTGYGAISIIPIWFIAWNDKTIYSRSREWHTVVRNAFIMHTGAAFYCAPIFKTIGILTRTLQSNLFCCLTRRWRLHRSTWKWITMFSKESPWKRKKNHWFI